MLKKLIKVIFILSIILKKSTSKTMLKLQQFVKMHLEIQEFFLFKFQNIWSIFKKKVGVMEQND